MAFQKILYTNEMFDNDLVNIDSDIKRIGDVTGKYDKVLVRHKCGYEWNVKPYNIVDLRCGCPICSHVGKGIKTQKEFEEKVANFNNDIEIIGEYSGINKHVKIRRKSCGHENFVTPSVLFSGRGCPYCSNRRLLVGYNDIATTDPWMIPLLADKEDAYRYISGSKKKTLFKCPDCGTIDEKQIGSVRDYGFACHYCSDGISYPNKFGRAMLKQLPVENVVYEYLPKWSQGKKYDNYFEYNGKQYILEMDGGFHFKDTRISPIERTKANDNLKNELAVANGMIMIRIDCNKPERGYIVEHVYDSLLSELFDLSVVDWKECEEAATTNLIKEACLYYETHKYEQTNKDIAKMFGISEATLKQYRNIGESVGWCEDSTNDLSKRLSLNSSRSPKHIRPFDVYDSEHNFIEHFEHAEPCAKFMGEKYNIYFSPSLIRRARVHNKPYHGFYFVESNK